MRLATTVTASLLAAALITALSCSSTPEPVGLSASCSINSDCAGSLVCAFGRCHVACVTTKDCGGSECVLPGVCELKAESTCSATLPCVNGLTCVDATCLGSCSLDAGSANQCLPTQTCTSISGHSVCKDNGGSSDAAAETGPHSDGGSHDATLPTDAGKHDGGSQHDTGVFTHPCTVTQFGLTALGDQGVNTFTSAVGARTASDLYLISGYNGPDPAGDGGGNHISLVYVQAFDAVTAASKGPTRPLFVPPNLGALAPSSLYGYNGVYVDSAAVSPSGEIALVYRNDYGLFAGQQSALYVAFLKSGVDAGVVSDGGAAGLEVETIVLLATESNTLPGPGYVIWSDASQAFITSWQYASATNNVDFLSVAKFLPGGQSAGGSTDLVPTNGDGGLEFNPLVLNANTPNGSVGESAGHFGVSYVDVANENPALTVLDSTGAQVGPVVEVVPPSPMLKSAWTSVAGTSTGFVYFYDNTTPASVTEVFVPTAGDAGVVGNAGAFKTFSFLGPLRAYAARAIGDGDGVGVALLYPDGVSFAYVNADGVGHQGPDRVLPHTWSEDDQLAMTLSAGSFVVSLFSKASYSAQLAATGCVGH